MPQTDAPSPEVLFDELVQLSHAARDARLAALARTTPGLANELRELLEADARAGDFLGVLRADDRRPGGTSDLGGSVPGRATGEWPAVGACVGPYRIVRRIGRGGMATVWLAHDDRLDRPVALKVVHDTADDADPPGDAGAPDASMARFVAEARAAGGLDHPHVVPVHDIGETPDGRRYIVMPFYERGSLADRLTGGPLAVDEAVRVAEQLAGALAAAHARGIVHRDVKPANVLFDATDGARLGDFGIAKLPGRDVTRTGHLLGTMAYLAPEQLGGAPVDHRADLWALGVTLHQMLAGRRPFAGDSPAVVMHAILAAEPAPLAAVRADVPAALDALVRALLAKDPAARPASATLVVRALRELATPGGTLPAAPVADPRRPEPVESRPLTPLVGRERELALASTLLTDARLLTLTGPGGTGKTRLALELARRGAGRHVDGAHVVRLAAVATADLVAAAVAQSLGLREGGAQRADELVAATLAGRDMLLVLDNFEHVLEAAPLVTRLLATAPRLTVLVTSREPLRLHGEQELPVPPLALPAPTAATVATVGESEAVRLFVQRARAGRPDFALTDENAADIASVCRRLDGLPLALELAAARTRVLSPRAIRGRLDQRFDLLRSDARDVEPRHRTLRDVIDWSYGLLPPDEQALFRELAVFVGGFTLDAAEAVATAPPGAGDVLDRVASLCDKSLLVRRDGADGEPRFDMLETVREYALARLRGTPDERAVRGRHARWMAGVADVLGEETGGPGAAAPNAGMHPQVDNALAALAWSTGPHGDPVDALPHRRRDGDLLALGGAVGGRDARGPRPRCAPPTRAPTRAARPTTSRATRRAHPARQGAADRRCCSRGCSATRTRPSPTRHARSPSGRRSRRPSGRRGTRARAAPVARRTRSRSRRSRHHALGDDAAAERSADAAVDAARRSGSAWARGLALGWRAMLAIALGRPDDAARDLARAEVELRAIGDTWVLSWCNANASAMLLAQGDAAGAARHAQAAVAALRAEPDWHYVSRGLDALGAVGAAWLASRAGIAGSRREPRRGRPYGRDAARRGRRRTRAQRHRDLAVRPPRARHRRRGGARRARAGRLRRRVGGRPRRAARARVRARGGGRRGALRLTRHAPDHVVRPLVSTGSR
jgi:predicted ATPase/serine/threonine protein kinase